MPTELNDLEEDHWETLLARIADGKCTPFLGAGVNAGLLPLGTTVAADWAREFHYPLKAGDSLDRVAQYLAVQRNDPMFPKEWMVKLLRRTLADTDPAKLDAFLTARDRTLGVLAALPLPVYITTNYDDLLIRALRKNGKEPRRELCRWNKYVRKQRTASDPLGDFVPDVQHPLVFHLHGHDDVPESLVLTEDDYLDFLVNVSRTTRPKQAVLPPRIEEALTGASLLFLGYALADINFRVIYRGLVGALEDSLRRISVSVQLPPHPPDPGTSEEQLAKQYLAKYFDHIRVRVFWGTADEFAGQLRVRWDRYRGKP